MFPAYLHACWRQDYQVLVSYTSLVPHCFCVSAAEMNQNILLGPTMERFYKGTTRHNARIICSNFAAQVHVSPQLALVMSPWPIQWVWPGNEASGSTYYYNMYQHSDLLLTNACSDSKKQAGLTYTCTHQISRACKRTYLSALSSIISGISSSSSAATTGTNLSCIVREELTLQQRTQPGYFHSDRPFPVIGVNGRH